MLDQSELREGTARDEMGEVTQPGPLKTAQSLRSILGITGRRWQRWSEELVWNRGDGGPGRGGCGAGWPACLGDLLYHLPIWPLASWVGGGTGFCNSLGTSLRIGHLLPL